jgi:hypothetical protein
MHLAQMGVRTDSATPNRLEMGLSLFLYSLLLPELPPLIRPMLAHDSASHVPIAVMFLHDSARYRLQTERPAPSSKRSLDNRRFRG